jgi:hypothetical protein
LDLSDEPLGCGGFGDVKLAAFKTDALGCKRNSFVAVKILRQASLGDIRARVAFVSNIFPLG